MSEDTGTKRSDRRRRITRAGRRRAALRMPAGVAGEGWSPSAWPADAERGATSERDPTDAVGVDLDPLIEEVAEGDFGGLEPVAVADDDDDARKTEEIQITPLVATQLPWTADEEKTNPRIRMDEVVVERPLAPRERDSESERLTNPRINIADVEVSIGAPITPSRTVVIAAAHVIGDAPVPRRAPRSPLPPPVSSTYESHSSVPAPVSSTYESHASLPAGVLATDREPRTVPAPPPGAESELDDAALQLVDVEEAEVEGERRPSRASPPPPPLFVTGRGEAAAQSSPGGRSEPVSLPSAPRSDGSGPGARTKPPATGAAPPTGAAKDVAKRPPPPPSANKLEEDRQKRKQVRQWWERFFSDDYLMTVLPPSAAQIGRQVDFIEASLGLSKGGTVLDVGCGLGLHSIELTRRGYLVVGLDLSLAMITRAAESAQQQSLKINFVHADIREMEFEGTFDGVISMGTTFGFFDEEANRDVLARLHQGLRPGGRMLLDVVNRDYVVGLQPNLVWFEGDDCVCMEESDFNYFNSRLSVKRTMMREDGRQSNAEYSLRLYALHELGQLVQQLGFRVIEVSGQEAVRGAFFGAHSPRILMLAERRASRTTAQQDRASIAFPPERGSAEIPKP